MSTVKAVNFQHPSSTAANLTLAADGTVSGGLPAGGRNLLYNGAMQVAQRGTSTASITGVGYYTADRYRTYMLTAGTWTQSIENDAPTGSGLRKSLKMLCTTANASLSAGSIIVIQQKLEGQDVQRVAKGTASGQQLTLSFWIKSNVTGAYVASLYDYTNTRIVSASYSVSASAAWEKKTITFPADTTGAIANDNAAGLQATFWLAAGTTFTSSALATVWASDTEANNAAGQTNLAAAINNYWQITGVQLEVGPVASAFEFKPYGQELRECQRYYYLHVSGTGRQIGSGAYYSASLFATTAHFPVTMRTDPSMVVATGTSYYTIYANNTSDACDTPSLARPGITNAGIDITGNVSGTQGHGGVVATNNAAASIAFSAEL